VKLATRMWLTGAVMPVLVMALVLLGASRWFEHALLSGLDRALLAQAAVESVSLFDGPRNEPHLHMARSPLVESVRGFAPRGSLFGPDGKLVMRYPPVTRDLGERLQPELLRSEPRLGTRRVATGRERFLVVAVASPRGEPYALQLEANLTQVDAATDTFRTLALSALLVTTLILVLAQSLQARRLRRRLGELTQLASLLRDGELEQTLPAEKDRDELNALREVLNHATRSLRATRDARERFVADAAHELRTPLTLLRTNIDLALRRERSHDELKQTLGELREEVLRLSQLSSRLLDLANTVRAREPGDLSLLVSRAVESIRGEATRRGISLGVHAEPTTVAMDAEAIRGAVDNLLGNALKYARSEISLCVRVQPDVVSLHVRDDGPGIAEGERELVFEPFHRAPGSQPGAGLGLAIVRATARAHRGRAYVAPTSAGAEVVLELPR
jgi:signal transduction histidine kinase